MNFEQPQRRPSPAMASNRPSKRSAQTRLNRNIDSQVLPPTSCQAGTKNGGKTSTNPPVLIADVIEISSDEEEVRSPPPPKRQGRLTPSVDVARLELELKRLQQENAALVCKHTESQQELEFYRKKKNSMSLDVADLEDHITCEICALKLWTPYYPTVAIRFASPVYKTGSLLLSPSICRLILISMSTKGFLSTYSI
ncbi:hypothetical protein E1B28_009987 [Marasmius oreades]|uniref:Uncharacterized protein n=1 Tax=Marasmius oreades TaxID=181124 RepID=A0A9P7RWW1_9AGAR|nr:uncharacterized protein E1B28_009987 [Marasmius oreades]KAG7090910.1 hypothetical protein E1B28_009987 [Marasmius oreades]